MRVYLGLFFIAVVVIGLFVINIQRKEINSLKGEKSVLMANNNFLVEKLKRSNENYETLARTNNQLKNAVKNDKSGFDWHYSLTSNPVLLEFKRMHQN